MKLYQHIKWSKAAHSRVAALFSALVLLFSVTVVQGAEVFTLITDEEYLRFQASGESPAADLIPKSLSNEGPQIHLEEPENLDSRISPPVNILLRFSTSDSTPIDMDSLKVTYGYFLRIDITDRLLEHAEIGEDHIQASNADLPSGKHEIFVEIRDERGRMTERKFTIRIS